MMCNMVCKKLMYGQLYHSLRTVSLRKTQPFEFFSDN